jgi:hypothetical protein
VQAVDRVDDRLGLLDGHFDLDGLAHRVSSIFSPVFSS